MILRIVEQIAKNKRNNTKTKKGQKNQSLRLQCERTKKKKFKKPKCKNTLPTTVVY